MGRRSTIKSLLAVAGFTAVLGQSQWVLAQEVPLANTLPFADQDTNTGEVFVNNWGTLVMRGNRWQVTQDAFTVTANTVIEFEFRAKKIGEVHGIGLENDNTVTSNRIFKLTGSQEWGRTNVATYTKTDGSFQKFSIPVGKYYTGDNLHVVFVSDNDVDNPVNASFFKNVKIVQSDTNPNPGNCMTALQQELLDAHNQARATGRQCGNTFMPAVAPLTWNCTLGKAAENHSNDMASNDFMSHTGSDGLSPFDRMANLGYNYQAAGENVAAGYSSVSSVMSGWLSSSGHCQNIMSSSFTEMGAAMKENTNSTYRWYWTVDLGKPF